MFIKLSSFYFLRTAAGNAGGTVLFFVVCLFYNYYNISSDFVKMISIKLFALLIRGHTDDLRGLLRLCGRLAQVFAAARAACAGVSLKPHRANGLIFSGAGRAGIGVWAQAQVFLNCSPWISGVWAQASQFEIWIQ